LSGSASSASAASPVAHVWSLEEIVSLLDNASIAA
jgi:hypothetical protein